MSTLHGDVPCADCGTDQNIDWFTESVFWNAVCPDDSPVLCLPCFIARAENVGYRPVGWRVLPEWGFQGTISPEHEQKQIDRHNRTMGFNPR